MRYRTLILTLAALALASCGQKKEPMPWELDPDFGKKPTETTEAEVGKPLPKWNEGYFDIHAVNSGRGECTFLIMPDGTSMLIDAGEIVDDSASYPNVPKKPNNLTRAVDTYHRYISHYLPEVCSGSIDYMMLTHFHNDHMGTMTSSAFETNIEGGYRKTGMLGLYDLIKARKWVDRIYPDYNDAALKTTDYTKGYEQLASFTKYNNEKYGLVAERFDLGSDKQFVMKYKPSDYDFKVDNIARSGCICINGKTTDLYGSASRAENGMCNGCLFTYGKFNYLTLGDSGANTKIEQPLATAMGVRVEAMKASHHFSVNCMTPAAVSIWTPRVVVAQSFYERDDQPNVTSIANFLKAYATEKHMYFTNVVEAQQTKHADVYSKASGINGHVVIRVSPGGNAFFVYMLDDTDFNYTVTKIDGPFACD